MNIQWQRILCIGVSFCLGLWIGLGGGSPLWAQPAPAVVPMELPQPPVPVLDLADQLTSSQEAQLAEHLNQLEKETGWKLRVLTQFDQTPGRQVKEYWGLNERSVLMVADPRGGNLLAFNVGDAVREILPRTFWIELQSRFGNQFYVQEHGAQQAILEAVDVLERCFRQGGCRVVPGLPQEQWILTLITSILGGIVFGFAGKPRHAEEVFNWRWALLISPLWFILFGAFGLGPVVTRTRDWLPVVRNILGFLAGALVIYLAPLAQPAPDRQ
ncbi:TPM domain-containing protein [Synechococcus sp. H65.1]|uniref:TPM domain-containing protein n=1 Tax=unclassified Synechococcus TaxID=2626047 RepID=UPI0039C2FBA9